MPIKVSCNLCGSDDPVVIGRKGRFGLGLTNVVCRKCGLVYVNPRMDDSELARFYTNVYREQFYDAGEPDDRVVASRLRKAEYWHNFIAPHVRPSDKVLDIGCETGSLLYLLHTRTGCEVAGIEPTTSYAEYGVNRRGLNILNGMFPDVALPHPSYDVVIICHVLEHMSDPVGRLRDVRQILSPGGRLFVSVPSMLHVRGKLERFFQHSHLYNFTPVTLRLALQKAGFRVRKERVNKRGIDVMAVVADELTDMPEDCYQDWREIVDYCRFYRLKYCLYGWIADIPESAGRWLKRRRKSQCKAGGGHV